MAGETTPVPAADNRPAGAQAKAESRRAAPHTVPARDPHSLAESVRDAALAALLAGVLGFFFIGLRTDIAPGGLTITTRWTALVVAILVVFAGRLALNLFVFRTRRPVTGRLAAGAAAGAPQLATAAKWLMRGLFVFALVLPFFFITFVPGRDRQFIDLAILIMTYIMLGWGLNIVVGLAGLLDLGYVAFYAVGAYSFALLAQHFDLGFWMALPLAGVLAAMWGLILGFPVLRLRGDYLAIVTLAFGEIIRIVLLNWYQFTNGPDGISGIPKPTLFGLELKRGEGGFADVFGLAYDPIHRFIFLYYIIFVLALITNLVTIRLRKLPVGRAWEALREDEIACRSLGINTRNTKLTAFAIGAMFGGFAGSFFATRQGFISPESFTFLESAIILAIVVLGGLGSQIGVVIASVVMIGGIEMLRNIGFLSQVFGDGFDPVQYRMLIFGLAMVLIMVWRPRGLIATREPSVALKEKKKIGADLVAQGEGH
ncbi:high-affinity branched-chain amino acid ABC transporter permease LivM [Aquibium sp. A9E412]|uniref:high-affinity branched-chain amino acid ABC transporter permease LivM n=1 Tax=Aquibium sp. A9E412 TaxID=2976767 RepID=UPI0025AF0171|nr:high-affinity branched-chain amino acid ABC transporter permease LivM [Aquibium sp. A9E412]MDN2567009.1 high-affinity branched-chain amino acid ABC transporter permease LivM [Aquibium sp. A9E412]